MYNLDEPDKDIMGWHEILVTESHHPFMEYYWPQGHIIGWEHTFINEIFHFADAIVNNKEVGPYAATFEDGYKCNVIMDAIMESAEKGKCVLVQY